MELSTCSRKAPSWLQSLFSAVSSSGWQAFGLGSENEQKTQNFIKNRFKSVYYSQHSTFVLFQHKESREVKMATTWATFYTDKNTTNEMNGTSMYNNVT